MFKRALVVAGLVLALLATSASAGGQPPVKVKNVYCPVGKLLCCGITTWDAGGMTYESSRRYCKWWVGLREGQTVGKATQVNAYQ